MGVVTHDHVPYMYVCTCMCMSSAARSNFCVYMYNGHRIFFVRSVATKLHACVKSTIPGCCSFCRTEAERLRQQWHDLASSPGPWDEARLSLSFNWMQTSLLAPRYNTITNSSVTQVDITIQISMLRRCVICLKSKLLRQTKEINQH